MQGSNCDVHCAKEFVVFYDDCEHIMDLVFDLHADDTVRDGKASTMQTFQDTCLSISPAVLLTEMDRLDDTCEVNISGAVSYGDQHDALCVDDDNGMKGLTGFTCAELKKRGILCR